MTDGVVLNPGTGGPTVDTETNPGNSRQMQRVKLVLGALDTDGGDVSSANALPVTPALVSATISLTSVGQIAQVTNPGYGTAGVQITSMGGGGAVQFVGSGDGANWLPIQGIPGGLGAGVTAANAPNGWQFDIAGVSYVGVQCTQIGSGAIAGTITLSPAPSAIDLGGGTGQETRANSWPVTIASDQVVSTSDVNLAQALTSDAPAFVAVTGDPSGDFAGVNLLEAALDDRSGLGFGARILNPVLTDANGATVETDAKQVAIGPLPIGGSVIVDTTGYDSFNITTQALAANVQHSNDQITWSALTGVPFILGAYVTAVTANAGFSFPVIGRWIKITATTAGAAVGYLRSAPWVGAYTTTVPTATAQNNMLQYGTTNVVTGGVAGLPGVGGNIAVGTARTANPVPVGGVDSANLTRVMLTDTSGRPQAQAVGLDAGSTARQIGALAVSSLGTPVMAVADGSDVDGIRAVELLSLILFELRIANQQRHDLLTGASNPDSPDTYRTDPAIFN